MELPKARVASLTVSGPTPSVCLRTFTGNVIPGTVRDTPGHRRFFLSAIELLPDLQAVSATTVKIDSRRNLHIPLLSARIGIRLQLREHSCSPGCTVCIVMPRTYVHSD